jgi:EPS-associated MarR family transcriptional regulator
MKADDWMDESHFKALREISRDGSLSQRDLAGRIGLSLGRVNYIVRSLMENGYIKARRFKNSRNKIAYMYVLTPQGIKKRMETTTRFLALKTREYEELRREIEELEAEVETGRDNLPEERVHPPAQGEG